VTGNLACHGQESEFACLSEQFLDALPKAIGDGWNGRLFLVPGDRDIDPEGSPPPQTLLAGDNQESFWDASEQGAKLRRWVWGRFEAYSVMEQRYARSDGEWLKQPGGHFVEIWNRGDGTDTGADGQETRIGVVGLNTAWIARAEEDAGQLSPGRPLVSAGLDAIADCSVRFVLGHHPLEWFTDEDSEAIRKLFAQHHVIYLHGHADRQRRRPGKGGGPAFLTLQSGCSFLPDPPDAWRQGLVWGTVDWANQAVLVEPRRWSQEAQGFICDPDAFPVRRRIADTETWSFPFPGTTMKPATEKPSMSGGAAGKGKTKGKAAQSHAEKSDGKSTTADASTKTKGKDAKAKDKDTGKAKASAETRSATEQEPVGPVQEPKGWRFIDAAGLAGLQATAPDPEHLLGFIDGIGPGPEVALSAAVPVRTVVTDALSRFLAARTKAERPCILLIEGPAGDGKTTAFFQVLSRLIETGDVGEVLWRERLQGRLPTEFVQKLARRPGACLIAVDDADNVTNDLTNALKTLQKAGRSDIHFIVGVRALSRGGGNREQEWQQSAILIRLHVRDLEAEDAGRIWSFWNEVGDPALGDWAGQPMEQAVNAITDTFARERKNTEEGALLGALLKVRTQSAPSDYGHRLLGPLNEQGAPGGTLLAGFAYIAQMHAEGFGFLSRTVLAAMLECDDRTCDQEVIVPLQEQGMVIATGQFIQTRHRRIAEISVKTLEEDGYAEALEDNLVGMVRTAILLFQRGHTVPNINAWQFQIADHYSKQGRHATAIRLARAVQESDRDNVQYLVHLSRVLRRAGRAGEALALFQAASPDPRDPRSFYQEWGAASSAAGEYPLGVWMLGMALADGGPPPDLELVRHALAGLGTAFRDLHEQTKDKRFMQARGAVGQMGLRLKSDDRSRQKFQKHRESAEQAGVGELTVDYAVGAIKAAVARGSDLYDGEDAIDMEERFPDPYALSYRTLSTILHNPQAAAKPVQTAGGGSGGGDHGRSGGKGRGQEGGGRDRDRDRERDRDRGKPRGGRGGKPGGGPGGGRGRGQPGGSR